MTESLRITQIERIRLRVPVRERMRPWAELLVSDWDDIEVLKITTNAAGVTGWGETVLNYSWGGVASADELNALVGQNPAAVLASRPRGSGLQQALLDVLGKALEVPAYQILGDAKVRDWCPIAWWVTKAPPEILAAEAADAVAGGYTALKFKGRPFFDVREQVAAVSAVTPPNFQLDIDFNGMLLTPAEALPLLRDLDQYERVSIYESPTRANHPDDLAFIRNRVQRPIAEHMYPSKAAGLMHAVDGFVVSPVEGWSIRDMAAAARLSNKSIWLQLIGTGITTAFALHHGSTIENAVWPAVTAMNLYVDDLVIDPIEVRGGLARVPEAPGLGVKVDEDALERFAYRAETRVRPRTILQWHLAEVGSYSVTDYQILWNLLRERGGMPVASPGSRLEIVQDDGSAEFDRQYRRVDSAPVWTSGAGL